MYRTEPVHVDGSQSWKMREEAERERNDLNEKELDSKRGLQGKNRGNVGDLRVENDGTNSRHPNEHERRNQRGRARNLFRSFLSLRHEFKLIETPPLSLNESC